MRNAPPESGSWPNSATSFDARWPIIFGTGFTSVNYRMLYFFHGRAVAILAHALTKENEVPHADIERAIERKKAFAANPARHSYPAEEV